MGFGGNILRFSLMLLRCTISWSFLLISRPLTFGRSIAALQLFRQPFVCLIANGMQFFLGSLSFFFFHTKDIQVQCTLSGTMCLLCHYLWMVDGLEVILFQDLDAPITANNMAVASSKLAVRSIPLSIVWFLNVCLRLAKQPELVPHRSKTNLNEALWNCSFNVSRQLLSKYAALNRVWRLFLYFSVLTLLFPVFVANKIENTLSLLFQSM